ncbi:MAG TPA: xanthine dehydrogenase family protein molybdopterin-binding subunit [Thermodesulfobacteriota bacterium]|nr:xanthine dehydrogenase family protein molybdopterin-binding subunit [Thermodesulfobacteriota bacterium]
MRTSMTRRTFLKGSLAAAGLTIGVSVTPFGHRLLNASEIDSFSPNAWFKITPNNKVAIFVGNSEMGQGVLTAHSMIIADELEADWSRVSVKQAPAADPFINPILGGQVTVASASVRGFYDPLRKAGAAGRAMLIKAAAETWKVPEDECKASMGTVKHAKSGRTLTYGQLCLKAAKLEVPKDSPLKKEEEFRYMGKPMPRVDVPDKVSGKAVYGLDVTLKDLHYAVIARPPVYGAKPLSFDQKAAEQVSGVHKVVQIPQGIAVCAKSVDAALKGRNALKVNWNKGVLPDMNNDYIEKSMSADLNKPMVSVVNTGDAKKAISEAAKKVEANYFVSFVAHTTMEPMNCTASVTDDRCDVWAPVQAQTGALMLASNASGLPKEKVHVQTTFLGCGLGRRAKPDFVVQAVTISKAVGKPVKVMWTREEDIKYDYFRAAASHRIEAGLDAQGRLIGWSHKLVSPSIAKEINPHQLKDGIDWFCMWGLADRPESYGWNNRIQYEIPNLSIEFLMSSLPIPCGVWRSVQNGPNAFVIESFIDELAHVAGKDPLEFRVQNLRNNMRARRVLETVAEKAGWGKPIPKGEGRGIAQHACMGSYVAQVADISVNKKDGAVKVHRIVAAVDCGPVVNPDPLVAQIEGGIINSLSTALKEEVKFENGGVKSANFDDYKIMKMSEIPEIEVHIVKSSEKIGGMGEPGVPPATPAVANAFFNATGVRIRRIPLTPKIVMDALKKA